MPAKRTALVGLSPALCIKSALRLPCPRDMTRVLVIDDSDDFRKLALRWFQSCGIEAEGVADGVQGLVLQRAGPADVIVTDIFMPQKDGIEPTHAMRRG